MKKQTEESGAIMVEAVLIFPLVLMAVMAMLYFGLFKLQEAAMLYQVQRVASDGSLMVSSPGYASMAENGRRLDGKSVDWTSIPEREAVDGYYKAYHKDFLTLYRELAGCSWITSQEVENYGKKVLDTVSVLAAGRLFQTKAEIQRDFWGASVVTELRFEVRTPGVLRFFDVPDTICIQQGAYRRAANPAGFMRNVDLAGDAVVVISEMLGLEEELGKITECLTEIRNILF